jgi:hypothetical protein
VNGLLASFLLVVLLHGALTTFLVATAWFLAPETDVRATLSTGLATD